MRRFSTQRASGHSLRHLFLLALCCGAALAAAPRPYTPEPFVAEYTVSTRGIDLGRHVTTLQRDAGGRWHYFAATKPQGIAAWFLPDAIREESWLEWHDGAWRPLRYRYARTGGKKERRVEIDFDWNALQAHSRVDGTASTLAIAPGTQDRLSVTLALMQDLARGATELRYPLVDRGRLKEWRFAREEESRITVPAGEFAAIKLKRLREDDDRDTLLWLAPASNALPVRIDQREEDGMTYRMELLRQGGSPEA